jgi:small conductance mechanosensitive channel
LIIASAAKSVVRRVCQRRQRSNSLGLLFGQLAQVAVVILGFLIALSIVVPSFQAGDLIKVLGVGSVAIGFAFQNILQTFLAGILILIHEPCSLKDFITINGIEGVVEDIQTKATVIIHDRRSSRSHSERGAVHESGHNQKCCLQHNFLNPTKQNQ